MSYISHKNKNIFVHLTKCAGTSMEKTLGIRDGAHSTIYDYSKKVDIKNYFKWCFVRNPWDRIVSVYDGHPTINQEFSSFTDFIETLYKNRKEFNVPHISYNKLPFIANMPIQRILYWPLIKCISIDNVVQMDFIGRFEQLEQDWEKILKLIGVPQVQLGKYNERRHKVDCSNMYYKDVYNQALIDMVAEIYREDIEYFKYTFD